MDSIINDFERRLKQLNWIIDIKKLQDMLKIKTQEGIEYICKKQHIGNQTKIIIKDIALNFYYENKINDSMKNDNFIKDNILIKLEAEIYMNDICLKSFNKGISDFKERNQVFNINPILNSSLLSSFNKKNELISLIEFLWNKGYEFSRKYPYPEEIDKQYNYIAEKTINILSVKDLKKFIKNNPEIYTYFDEKKIPENINSLKDFREIDYSYKNIVAKMYTKIGKLNEKLLVFDTEGIKELANCYIGDYKDIYRNKLIEEMFKCKELYEKAEIKTELIQSLEPIEEENEKNE